ncbi:MAG: DivIVA domain-containing protein [Acidimicrobiia bacterium]|nr:DivIVA domain-containing protein [Acidimicrobiia bacterium]
MPEDTSAAAEGVPEKEFAITRKGYNPEEVDAHLAEIDVSFRELEEYAARLKQELADARNEIRRLEAAEQESVDKAMLAVFDAKERVLDRARQKAREIENEARIAAGMAPLDEEEVPAHGDEEFDELVGIVKRDTQRVAPIVVEQPAPAAATPPPEPVPPAAAGPDPTEVLRQMLQEADAIRSQLENGLSSAFSEIERMQQNAEERAAAMLDEARREAAGLRSAGKDGSEAESKIEVTLAAEGNGEQRSRYSKNSAKLPRIGDNAGESVLASMNQLRNKLREAEAVAQQVQEPSAS